MISYSPAPAVVRGLCKYACPAIKVHLQSMTGRGETNVDQHNCDESRPGQILVFQTMANFLRIYLQASLCQRTKFSLLFILSEQVETKVLSHKNATRRDKWCTF